MDTLRKFPIQKAYKTKLATVPLVIAREAVQAYVFLCGENELLGLPSNPLEKIWQNKECGPCEIRTPIELD